jgi:hypothetical protein
VAGVTKGGDEAGLTNVGERRELQMVEKLWESWACEKGPEEEM